MNDIKLSLTLNRIEFDTLLPLAIKCELLMSATVWNMVVLKWMLLLFTVPSFSFEKIGIPPWFLRHILPNDLQRKVWYKQASEVILSYFFADVIKKNMCVFIIYCLHCFSFLKWLSQQSLDKILIAWDAYAYIYSEFSL